MVAELFRRGYTVFELPVDGHRPDTRLDTGEYVEVKTGHPNVTVELDSLKAYRQIELNEDSRVYIVWIPDGDNAPVRAWTVSTPDSLAAGIIRGPNRRSGSGSLDDWYLCKPRGVPFDKFFPVAV